MFHNVLMTSLTPLRNTNETHCWDNRPFTTIWPDLKDKKFKDTTINKTIKKKPKRNRTMITTEQLRVLENVFSQTKYIDVDRRKEISECLQMDQKCIKIWFQNRRMKEKKELSESCDSASDGVAESVSPPLETAQPINNASDLYTPYLHPYGNHVGPQYTYYIPDNFPNIGISRNDADRYENVHNFPIPEYTHFLNIDTNAYKNNDYTQCYGPQTNFRYYNEEFVNDRNVRTNVEDSPVNIFDTSYL